MFLPLNKHWCMYDVLCISAIAEAVAKWKAEREARLAGGGGGEKEEEEEEEHIYAVQAEEVRGI